MERESGKFRGQRSEFQNGANGRSNIEGKVTKVATNERWAASESQLRSRNALTSHEIAKAGRRLAAERTQEDFSMISSALDPYNLSGSQEFRKTESRL